LAECVIAYGQRNGSNERNNYANRFYTTTNPSLNPTSVGNPGLRNLNRWQSLELDTFIDQSSTQTDTPTFLVAEWNEVEPFAITVTDIAQVARHGTSFSTYLNPGTPAL
jgi:hypothetical protein